jgi:glycosyltransferase involved in cell wall biosynthesis
MKISYAIPVCNEHVDKEDEIVIQCDQGNTTPEVYESLNTCKKLQPEDLNQIKIIEFPLKGDFSAFKNNLKNNCTGDWIFQIDADELPHESLITNLKELLKLNPTTELFLVPRVNTVEGLTQEHINKWRWNVNEKGWVNWPDYQTRIIQNSPTIQWTQKVHEVIIGMSTKGLLPMEEEWCLYHPKHIDRQEAQNRFYEDIENIR